MKNFVKRLFKGDPVLMSVVIILMLMSLLLIYSSTGKLAYNERGGNTWYYFLRHLLFSIAALGAMGFMKFFSWQCLYKNVGWLLGLSAVLVCIAAFGGKNVNGAGRWIFIPGLGMGFQPSEFAKIAIVLFAARLLSDYQEEDRCAPEVLRYFFPPLLLIVLIFLDNFSTSALALAVCFVMCWMGRVPFRLLAKWLGIAVGALVVLVLLGVAFPQIKEAGRVGTIITRMSRFFGSDDGKDESQTYDYQSNQAHIAVMRGGVMGQGPGNSEQRNFLPHPYSDFMYAIIIEEYGLVGGIFILLLYIIIIVRVGVIAQKTLKTEHLNPRGGPVLFPALVVIGLGCSLVLQALFHMGVNVGCLPVTGQTLPLVSMGGTSLLFVGVALGIILNISYAFSPEGMAEEAKKARVRNRHPFAAAFRTEPPSPPVYPEEELLQEIEDPGTDASFDPSAEEDAEADAAEEEARLEKEGRQVLRELRKQGRRNSM